MTMTTTQFTHSELALRHVVATVVYRAAKVLRDAPKDFSKFRPGPESRSAGEILAHVCDLYDWILTQAQGSERWRNSTVGTWAEDTERFFQAVTAFDAYVASGAPLHASAGKLFQGGIADSLTHIGQIAMLRRLAGSRVRGENYSVANIEAGRTGAAQNAAVQEFD